MSHLVVLARGIIKGMKVVERSNEKPFLQDVVASSSRERLGILYYFENQESSSKFQVWIDIARTLAGPLLVIGHFWGN